MEFRKELILKNYYKSDIFNTKTGYYKTENIFPITPKPTETRREINQFIPNYKKIIPKLRLFNDLAGHIIKRSYTLSDITFNFKRKNSDIHALRKYTKTIRDNCFDEKGNFSAKKRFRFEFYGKDKNNNSNKNNTFQIKRNKSIKEMRKKNLKKLDKSLSLNNEVLNAFNMNNNKINKRIYSYSNINLKEKNDFKYNGYYKKKIENIHHKSIKSENINNPINHDNTQKKKKKNFTLFKSNKRENSLNLKKTNIESNKKEIKTHNKNSLENDDYYIEIKNDNNENSKNNIYVDKKKLTQIFLKNGLHIYNFNENGANILSNNSKFEAKLRKNKEDKNFDKNYRNVVKELNKINIKVNRVGLIYDNCIFNKNSKIRKGTPGKNLKKNNNKLNYGIKRDKYVLPQQNQDYKNGYKYNLNHYNHKK